MLYILIIDKTQGQGAGILDECFVRLWNEIKQKFHKQVERQQSQHPVILTEQACSIQLMIYCNAKLT